MSLSFKVDMQDLTEIEAALGMTKDKSKLVLRAAINNAAKQIEKQMVNETNDTYRFQGKKAAIKSANTIKKATVGKMEAVIKAKGPANELLDFDVKPRTYFPAGRGAPRWVKSRGRKDRKLARVARFPSGSRDKYKGFVVKFKSGHLAMVERVPGKKMKGKPHKEALEALYSIATPKMEEVSYRNEIEDDVPSILEKCIEAQITRLLG